MEFKASDIKQIEEKGLSVEKVQKQIENFENGFPFVKLISPAIKGEGILELSKKEILDYISYYEINALKHGLLKFVPASGAATRMFKDLYEFTGKYMGLSYTLKEFPQVKKTIDSIKEFAFYDELKEKFRESGVELDDYLASGDYATVVNYILNEIGLNYGNSPKAWIIFHKYENEVRTAFEEHFVEATNYAKQKDDTINIHFTVSPEHKEGFEKLLNRIKKEYEKRYNVKYNVSFSVQKPSTDTVAVNEDNTLAYDKEGNLIFRPAGHGALIENLNDCKGDIIFIKNIDNVAHDKIKEYTYSNKKLIGGVLLKMQDKIFNALKKLEGNISELEVSNIRNICKEIGVEFKENESIEGIKRKLNRPIRVCGMVKNEGEPGGGPFWVENSKGEKSLQIIESAQIDMSDNIQKDILSRSTHFNPVDLVCGVKTYNGENFDLTKYVDPQTGFISIKSKDGVNIKAQELPGLWNGAMADWITIFVEVPLETFTPVKVLNDLLRDVHQN